MNIHDFKRLKLEKKKITMLTCYDFTSAKIIDQTPIDCVLVGDTASMVMHGYDNTIHATMEMMVMHTQAVARGLTHKFIIGDLPFLSYRKSLSKTMSAVQALMQAGAQAVKLEGVAGNVHAIQHIVESGIPVMGHIGLTPQSIHALGGFKVQGKHQDAQTALLQQAQILADIGCFALVLECVPHALAHQITAALPIPTIGIGAGPHTDGQVLVWQDVLGMQLSFKPKFLKTYLNGAELMRAAIHQYVDEVVRSEYPVIEEHTY